MHRLTRLMLLASLVASVVVAACALQGGVVTPPSKPPDRTAEFTETCTVIWQEELGRPIDPPALADCLTQAHAGRTGTEIRQIVHDSAEAVAYRARPLHVDPWTAWTTDAILAFKGSLFTVYAGPCDLPFGPRPHQPTNIIFFGAFFYTPEQRACTFQQWTARGYTHGVVGPFVDPGYHGQVPGYDLRDDPAPAIAVVQEAIDAGFIVPIVVVPDHWGRAEGWGDHVWTPADLRGSALEAVYKTAAFQQIARVVMLCWECQGSRYGWSNRDYIAYGQWLAATFPDSTRILHTIADIEAPVGNGDETNTANCHGLGPDRCLSNGQAWARLAPYFHVWFHQSSALFTPDHVADNGQTDSANWFALWDAANPASFERRFGDPRVYGDWPKGQIVPIPAEFLSYEVYNGRRTEDEARAYGAKAITLGARGSMDGAK